MIEENKNDKRSVATDALETLGTIIGEGAGRDAIHLAVEPVVAAAVLWPGEHIGLLADGTAGKSDKPLGIVDPFLPGRVNPGERFWLVVFPRTITSLRHVWSHPAFTDGPVAIQPDLKAGALEYLQATADTENIPLETLLEAAQRAANEGEEYVLIRDDEAHGPLPAGFWANYTALTGHKPGRAKYFSCSC